MNTKRLKTGRYLPSVVLAMCLLALTGCYLFNSSKEGFFVIGVLDGDSTTMIGEGTLEDLNAQFYQTDGLSFDLSDDAGSGCLKLHVVDSIFPDDASSGFARVDIVSPLLSGWDDAAGYAFAMMANIPGVWIQPLLKVRDSSGDVYFLREVDSSGAAVFHELTQDGGWEPIKFARPGALDETVLRVHIRIFIENGTITDWSGSEALIYLDAVGRTYP